MSSKKKNKRNADAKSAAKCMLEMKKVMLAKIIQKNESVNEMFNIVMDNYDEKERMKAADRMLTLIASDEKELDQVLHDSFRNALKFYMLVFVYRIREFLGIDKEEVYLGICPF